jgi:hypothetical protein
VAARRKNVTETYDLGPPVITMPMIIQIRPATTVLLRGIRPSLFSPYLHRQFFTSPPNFSGTMSEFYNLKAKLPGDKEYDFEQLKGKVVLIVNVASKW